MSDLLIPAQEVETELIVENSRFITTLGPIFAQDEAKAIIARIKRRFPDASHHVSAYVIGHGNSITTHCTDDGEPAGTAGRPALSVLMGSGLGNIYAVITRYFGGTKLGTGGLVKSYGEAVKTALALLPRARLISTATLKIEIKYPYLERVRLLTHQMQCSIVDETFAGEITLTVRTPLEQQESFQQALINLTSGAVQIKCVETNAKTIVPIEMV